MFMVKNSNWHDDYWLLLMQIYLRRPVGVKPVYCRSMVDLGLELHINPKVLAAKMQEIGNLETPRIERIWQTYSDNPRKLARATRLLREMKGFGKADEFYNGVELNETWERDWQPLPENERITPVILILVLDLYFRLTPPTMVKETPEVQELARLTHITTDEVVEILDAFLHCDPYLNRRDISLSTIMVPCQNIWQRYGNGATEDLASLAALLKEYYKIDK
jgi:hypothetical protein